MRFLITVVGAVLLSTTLSAESSPLEQVRKEFMNAQGFRVEFRQSVEQDLFPEDSSQAAGYIQFQRPHRLKWVYESPAAQAKELVYDGTKLMLVKDGQSEELPQPKDIALQNSFAFLWGEADLKNFEVQVVSDSQFVIKPKADKETGFKAIEVSIQNRRVKSAVLIDPLDGKSLFEFKNWQKK